MESTQSAVIRTARHLWLKGWAERNAGNLSVRLRPGELPEDSRRHDPWRPLETATPELGGERLLFTDTGSHMRLLELDPPQCTSVIELDGSGERFRVVRRGQGSDGRSPPARFGAEEPRATRTEPSSIHIPPT
jgi:ribulose-5-phosphate 4-epimerase/fuculose-1-phosphate aldolase